MTAPVAISPTQKNQFTMRFFLPKRYKTVDSVPKPTRSDVSVVKLPETNLAVRTFSGRFNQSNIDENAKILLKALRRDNVEVIGEGDVLPTVFGYNPPWTLPWMRTNEVAFAVKTSTDVDDSKMPGEVPK